MTPDLGQQQFDAGPADNHSVIPRVARIFLTVAVVLGAAYFALPPSPLRAVVYCAIELSTVAALAAGARIWRPSRPLAWYLLAAGQLSFTVGDAINYAYEWVFHLEAPYPSVADGFYLAFYPLLAAGLLLLVRGRAPGRDWASLVEATIIATGLGLLSWVFLIGPNVRAPGLALPQRLVSIAYPLCDVLLLAVAVRLWRTGGHTTTASRLLAVGLTALLAGDTVYPLSLIAGHWQVGGPLDAIWILYYAALGLAALHPLAGEVALQAERKRVMQTVLRATEQERLRLAADLHDGPVQELTALRYSLARARTRVQRGQPEEAEALLAGVEVDLATGIGGLRRLMSELRPAVLDEQGLEAALRTQARAFEAANGVACDVHSDLAGRLAPGLETVLYRVTQESLTNIGKHARASRVTVSLAADNGGVRLRIHDDGVGFDPMAARELVGDGHFGLVGMRERVEMVGGRMVVDSAPGEGTTVDVRMTAQPAAV